MLIESIIGPSSFNDEGPIVFRVYFASDTHTISLSLRAKMQR